jgi:hypothetical protein
MFDELLASTRRLLRVRRAVGDVQGNLDAVRDTLRDMPGGLAGSGAIEPEVSEVISHARERMRAVLRKEGLLAWIPAPIAAAIASVRARLAAWRAQASYLYAGARILTDEAATLVTVAVIAGATATTSMMSPPMTLANARGDVAVARYRSSGDASAIAGAPAAGRAWPVAGNVGGVPASFVQPHSSTTATVGIHRDRRINVTQWVSSWVPGDGTIGNQDSTWVTCDPSSAVLTTACDAYDTLPRGPWGH